MSDVSAIMDQTKESSESLLEMVKFVSLSLDPRKHKGQRGRIAVIGGSQEYTGAPYFAAIAALRMGADLAHVFCPKEAAPVIKSYNPDLIVHPLLDSADGVNEICQWLDKMHAVVIGPGLGRKSSVAGFLKTIINKVKSVNIPMILDADGIYFLTEDSNIRKLVSSYPRSILTPNVTEFARLYQLVTQREMPSAASKGAFHLALELGHVTIVRKGPIDAISNGTEAVECTQEGSACRCGGQGDLLSGVLAVYSHWAIECSKHTTHKNLLLERVGPMVAAAYASCYITRRCNHLAFNLSRNGAPLADSMTTSDMIDVIHVAKHLSLK